MKRLTMILLATFTVFLLMTLPAVAEVVEGPVAEAPAAAGETVTVELPDETLPDEDIPGTDALLTAKLLGSMVGMVLISSLLTQGIKMLFMRSSSAEAIRTMAFIVSAMVVIVAKLVSHTGFEVADILILPGNAIVVWLNAMKSYEFTIGAAGTPAGTIRI